MNNKLEFEWRVGDYELRAAPRHLVPFDPDEDNVTVDLVKHYEKDGRNFCYSIAFFKWDDREKSFDLYMVGERFKDIDSDDLPELAAALKVAYDTLMLWVEHGGRPYVYAK